MSYDELPQHAVDIERSAVEHSLKQRGFQKNSRGEWFGGASTDASTVQAAYDVTVNRYQGVCDMFTPFTGMPDPKKFEPMSADLEDALKVVATRDYGEDSISRTRITTNTILGRMDSVYSALYEWRGTAAVAFRAKFLEPFPAITTNQFALVATLYGAIQAEKALWEAARRDVDEIAHKALAALDMLGECSRKDQTALLTVAASVFTVAASVATGGASIGLTVVGAAAAGAAGIPGEEPPRVEFGGETPDAIIGQVQDALNRLAAQIADKERLIADAMLASSEHVASRRDAFVAPRPWLADASVSALTSWKGLGESM